MKRLQAQVPQVDPAVITGTGECLNCGQPLAHGRWCDKYCRDDWTRIDVPQ